MEFVKREDLKLPDNLPAPLDDGQAAHLLGARLPPVAILSTNNEMVRLDLLKGRSVVFIFLHIRLPGQTALFDHWDTVPGATGCTIETCGFRDNYLDFLHAKSRIFGLSVDSYSCQKEACRRLSLPFPLLTDANFNLAIPLQLPMFDVNEHTLLKRLTLIINDGVIEHVFYPVFPADTHAESVLLWLQENKRP